MADLNELQSADSVKIVGSDSTGTEQTPVQSTSQGGLHINLRNNSGVELGTSGNPVRIDTTGTTTQPISAVSLPLPTGAATSSLQTTGNTSLSNIDNKLFSTTTQPATNALGVVVRPISLELPTFSIAEFDVAIGNNKSMLALQNTGTSVVRVREVWIINDRTTATTGIAGEFQVNRIASFTGGTAVTPVTYDTADALPAGITAATNATVAGEGAILRRGRWSTDEWGPGTSDVESFDHAIQQVEPFWRQTPSGKALTIRQNEGLHVKFATNSTAGSFTIRMIFTVE